LFNFVFVFIFVLLSDHHTNNLERDIARILQEQEFVTKRMREYEPELAASKRPTEAKVGFAAIQEMARLQEQQPQQDEDANNDLSFLRFDPQSNRMTLESSSAGQKSASPEKQTNYGKFPLEIPTPLQSPILGAAAHKLKRVGSWR
jgi:hypothetical protein